MTAETKERMIQAVRWVRSPWGWMVIAVVVLVGLFGIISLVKGEGSEDKAEATAINFFKAVWVDGDTKTGRALLEGREEPDVPLDRRAEEVQRMKPTNSPVLISTEKVGESIKEIYIHRPQLGDGLAVTVSKVGDKWQVSKYTYNMASRYEILKRMKPKLEWKEVQP
ncbi:hypothetical protein EMG21_29035 [Klebsiella pneumoniae]|nr:hypothetical protein EMG21_29035 [Klebsiella pneumoniae]